MFTWNLPAAVAQVCLLFVLFWFLNLRILDFTNCSVTIRIGARARLCTAYPPTIPTGMYRLLLRVS